MPETLLRRVRRLYLDAGGYARNDGFKYYGHDRTNGEHVYAWDAEVPYQHHATGAWETKIRDGSLRAADYASARAKALALFPGARLTR